MIKLERLSWRRAHPSYLAGRDAAASNLRDTALLHEIVFRAGRRKKLEFCSFTTQEA
jgi:hypothetical protein